jgi:ABC-type branched-subunit amino acid transport system ATPase component
MNRVAIAFCRPHPLITPDSQGRALALPDVIFETTERIREEDDTVLLMEQQALAAFEIADYLYVPEFGKLNMLVMHPSCSTSPSSPQPTWKAIY